MKDEPSFEDDLMALRRQIISESEGSLSRQCFISNKPEIVPIYSSSTLPVKPDITTTNSVAKNCNDNQLPFRFQGSTQGHNYGVLWQYRRANILKSAAGRCPPKPVPVTSTSNTSTVNPTDGSQRMRIDNHDNNISTETRIPPSNSRSMSIYSCDYCKPKNVQFCSSDGYKLHSVRYHCENFFSEERSQAIAAGVTEKQFKEICGDLVFKKFKSDDGKCTLCQKYFGNKGDFVHFKWHILSQHFEDVRKQVESAIGRPLPRSRPKVKKTETTERNDCTPTTSHLPLRCVECLCGAKLSSIDILSTHSKSCSKINFTWNPGQIVKGTKKTKQIDHGAKP